MKILHLTDYHFSNDGAKSLQRQKDLATAVLNKAKDIDFDLVFFTGDLVNDGKNKKWFNLANDLLIKPLLKEKGMSSSNLFFCQGNHDVNRDKIRKPYIKYLDEEIEGNDHLNSFANFKEQDFVDTLDSSRNYYEFLSSLDKTKGDFISEMYTTHIREIDGKTFGIVSINTAWRSNGDDENKLLFPTIFINEALEKIPNVYKKILLHHHPLNFFKSDNQYELEDLIHNKFDITFFGHIHKGLASIDYTPNTGLIKIISPAALKKHQGGEIGFSLVEFNFEKCKFLITTYLYNERHEFFYVSPNALEYDIPENKEIKEQNSFRKTLRKLLKREEEVAKELFVAFGEKDKTFLDIFVNPILKQAAVENVTIKSYDIKKILSDDSHYLIIDDDKCGKTSLLKKIQIDILLDFEHQTHIPFHLDMKYENDTLDIRLFVNRVRNYFDLNRSKTEELLKNKKFVITIDNYIPSSYWQKNFFSELINKYPKCKIIASSSKSADIEFNQHKFGDFEPIVLKFENLRKKQIRALTNKWTPMNSHKTEEIVLKISSIFRQMSIPYNFWSVSLFLWVFKRSGEKSIQNNVGLVSLYIESLLERENLIKSNANFAYEKYLKLLGYLAHFLLIEHQGTTYSASEIIILNFIQDYLIKNPRNKNVNAVTVWEYLKDRGIFKNVEDDLFSFRLNGVFEYFLAYYMKIKPEFLQKILAEDNIYLSFKNEFEIYAGFSRDDEAFLDTVYAKSKRIFSKLKDQYGSEYLDQTLQSKVGILPNYERKLSELTTKAHSLTFEEQDDLEELANELGIDSNVIEGVRKKSPIEINQEDINNLEDALFILGRVFRNIDEIDSVQKVNEIFEYYIKTLCYWGFKIIDMSKIIDFQANFAGTSDMDLLYQLMSKFVPIIVQTTATNHINQKNLDGIILDKISNLMKSKKGKEDQFELFILLFMLVDLDLSTNREYILQAAELISIPVLKFAILLKLTKYLAFNTNEDKELENFLKKAIQKEKFILDKNTKMGDLQKGFSETKKQRLLNRNTK